MAVACPSREIFRHITSRWGAMVILALEVRTYRFSELRRRIGGVSERMLAHTLHLLEGDHLIQRQAHAVVRLMSIIASPILDGKQPYCCVRWPTG